MNVIYLEDILSWFAWFGTICTILKSMKNTHGGVLLLVKWQDENCTNGIKSHKAFYIRLRFDFWGTHVPLGVGMAFETITGKAVIFWVVSQVLRRVWNFLFFLFFLKGLNSSFQLILWALIIRRIFTLKSIW